MPRERAVPPSDEDGLALENVGYTIGDYSPHSYIQMKLKAVTHCLQGGKFVASQLDSRPIQDFDNTQLLSWAFPHLDLWGIGGFHDPRHTE